MKALPRFILQENSRPRVIDMPSSGVDSGKINGVTGSGGLGPIGVSGSRYHCGILFHDYSRPPPRLRLFHQSNHPEHRYSRRPSRPVLTRRVGDRTRSTQPSRCKARLNDDMTPCPSCIPNSILLYIDTSGPMAKPTTLAYPRQTPRPTTTHVSPDVVTCSSCHCSITGVSKTHIFRTCTVATLSIYRWKEAFQLNADK